jgi:hypothetical protein
VEAYIALIMNADLRKKFGESGRRRAREVFDWRVIIRQYQELWQELARRRAAAANQPTSTLPPHPLRPDPYTLFSDYPTAPFSPQTVIALAPESSPQMLDDLYQEPILQYLATPLLMAELEELRNILSLLESGPQASLEVVKQFSTERHEVIIRGILWLLKAGLVRRQYGNPAQT